MGRGDALRRHAELGALLGPCRPRARSRPSTRDHAPRARADTGSVGLDHRELRHQRRHFIDDAVAREDFKGLECDGRRPGMTRICKAMAEGADLSAFVDQRLILARGQPARLLARPPVGRLAMWPGPPGDSIRLKRPGPPEAHGNSNSRWCPTTSHSGSLAEWLCSKNRITSA